MRPPLMAGRRVRGGRSRLRLAQRSRRPRCAPCRTRRRASKRRCASSAPPCMHRPACLACESSGRRRTPSRCSHGDVARAPAQPHRQLDLPEGTAGPGARRPPHPQGGRSLIPAEAHAPLVGLARMQRLCFTTSRSTDLDYCAASHQRPKYPAVTKALDKVKSNTALACVLRGSACAGAGATVLCRARAGPAHPDQHVACAAERRALCGQGRRRRAHSFCPERWMADDAQRAGAWHAPGHLPRPPPCAACPAAPTQGRGSETRGSTRGGAGAAVKALHARHTINSVYLCQSAACRACRHWCVLFTRYPRRGWVLMHRWRRCERSAC